MIGLVVFIAIVALLLAFDYAADRWGVDSRTMTSDGRPVALFSR